MAEKGPFLGLYVRYVTTEEASKHISGAKLRRHLGIEIPELVTLLENEKFRSVCSPFYDDEEFSDHLDSLLFDPIQVAKAFERYPHVIPKPKAKKTSKKTVGRDTAAHVRRRDVKNAILKIKDADAENVVSQRNLCDHPKVIEAYGSKPSVGYINRLVQDLKRAGHQLKWPEPGRKPSAESVALPNKTRT